jgi:hypothetical protein
MRSRKPNATPSVLEGPITVGSISPPLDPRGVDLESIGYVEDEWFASGSAADYTAVEDLTEDGAWEVEPKGSAPYKTRLVVRRPADPAASNGVVALEWLNVSALELSPDWSYVGGAMVDEGVIWIGLSTQALGVNGGGSLLATGSPDQAAANRGIRATNPERYRSLDHPGDSFAYEIYSQVAAALRSRDGAAVLGGAPLERILAVGESQSAAWLTTYINAFQPATDMFDGFFIHSRGARSAGLDGTWRTTPSEVGYRFRTDLAVPIMVIEAETDVGSRSRYVLARQPDTEHLRVWEMAGTAHSDAYMVGGVDLGCGPINTGPHHWIAKAAFAALVDWVTTGKQPNRAPVLEIDPRTFAFTKDRYGNTRGGVRTPAVDVPVSVLSGDPAPGTPPICALLGSTTPFDAATLKSLYPSAEDYLGKVNASLENAIAAGFIREKDRDGYLAEVKRNTMPNGR